MIIAVSPSELVTRPGDGLRSAVLVAQVTGMAALGVAGLVLPLVALGLSLAVAAASLACARGWSPRARAVRKGLSLAVLTGTAVAMVGGLSLAGSEPVLVALPLALAGLTLAHALVLETVRDLLVAVTISCATLVLATGLVTGTAVLLPLLLAWPALVCALVLAHRERHRTAGVAATRTSGVVSASRVLVRTTAGAVALAVLGGAVVFLLLPRPDGSAEPRWGNRLAESLGASGPRLPASGYVSGDMDLRARGDLPDTPVVRVPADSPHRWRGAYLVDYDGATWRGDSSDLPLVRPLTGGWSVVVDGDEVGLPAAAARTDEVVLERGFSGEVLAPGSTRFVGTAGGLVTNGSGRLLLDGASTGAGSAPSYVVGSASTERDAEVLRAAEGADLSDPRWTALPDDVPDRVGRLAAEVTAGTATRYEAVRAVEDFLGTHAAYDLGAPLPPPGADNVDHFLFVDRVGFCMHFASAEAVMLRSVGIPARIATGFAGGEPAQDGTRVMKGTNAHAWVEVWYPGVGWVESDPTPAAALGSDPGPGQRLVAVVNRLLEGETSWRWTVAGGLVLVVGTGLALLLLLRWARAAHRHRRPLRAGSQPRGPLLQALSRLDVVLERTGRPRLPAESAAELFSRLPWDDDRAHALRTLQRELYGSGGTSTTEAEEAARVLDRIGALVEVGAGARSTQAAGRAPTVGTLLSGRGHRPRWPRE